MYIKTTCTKCKDIQYYDHPVVSTHFCPHCRGESFGIRTQEEITAEEYKKAVNKPPTQTIEL